MKKIHAARDQYCPKLWSQGVSKILHNSLKLSNRYTHFGQHFGSHENEFDSRE